MADAERHAGLTVDRVTDTEALLALASDWRRLHAVCGADIFMAWPWQLSWWRHLAGARQLWVLVARGSEGRVHGLLALSLERATVGLLPVRRLRLIGDDQVGSDYLDALIEPGMASSVLSAFAGVLEAHRADWDLLELRDMDMLSGTASQLHQALGADYAVESTPGLLCPGAVLDPIQSPDEFLRQCRRGENYTRRRKWLQRQPGFWIECSQDPKALAPALDQFFRLHRLRWAEAGGSSGIIGAPFEAFHREALAGLAASGHVRLYTLWVEGLAVASVYALSCGQCFYYYQSGMDPAWRPRSAGLVLIGETFADALRSGFTRYDFLRGEEAYKSDWVDSGRRLVSHRLYRRGGRGAHAAHIDRLLRRGKTWLGRFV
jgi:CelD/BcsL family acetyltransferase involved in cellulose biosynthesis